MEDKVELEKDKIRLEQKKIELEIKELKKSWYQKPAILVSAILGIVAILSFMWVFLSGVLDTKNERLAIQKERLILDIQGFEAQKIILFKEKQSIIASNQKIANERDSLKVQLAEYVTGLKNGNSQQSVYINLLQKQNIYYQKQISLLSSELNDRVHEIHSLNKIIALPPPLNSSGMDHDHWINEDLGFESKNEEIKQEIKKLKERVEKLRLQIKVN